ncbi:F-box domain-containing protein [Artemisia annua]|uniref:F-box domain-containing protein n=1 Tax=Artemisia annua TaxID=35608 RepID=A0A2U1M6E0_ARTAN|nr:F-box domain-containing protein [Artemisia annua]
MNDIKLAKLILMEKLIPDVYEKILVTLDVKNLVRCKSVCKSWKFLISGPRFIKAHLNYSYNNNDSGHSMIHGAVFPRCGIPLNPSDMFRDDRSRYYILGSSNGLVFIRNFRSDETLVINPATREEKMLPKSRLLHENVYETCWGFGYDSVTDDYKVVLGVINHEKKTCFQVLSLKSNAWKLIGQLHYTFCSYQRVGIFCNGALHWAMSTPNQDTRAVILSFDLSQEEFKEIPQPDDPNNKIVVGIMEECLCILGGDLSTNDRCINLNRKLLYSCNTNSIHIASYDYVIQLAIPVLMERLIPDVYEKILVTLYVKNLVRCKSMCKSWKFLISDPRFIKAHLNHSYNNNDNGHSKGATVFPSCGLLVSASRFYILGSSNGLVCIRNFGSDETLVVNPATREEKMLPKSRLLHKNVYETCWGFGYDSVTDDYKVVLGVINHEKRTCFQVLSLKSNAWKPIEQVNYTFCSYQRISIFCNGALHWAMYTPNQDTRAVILSFDLSQEEFKEIPLPVDPNNKIIVGIMEECLCLFALDLSTNYSIWVMQKYNVNQSWKRVERNCILKVQSLERLTEMENDVSNGRSTQKKTWFFKNRKFQDVPNIIVESLVSPHL